MKRPNIQLVHWTLLQVKKLLVETQNMFGLFKKKTEIEKLQAEYERLLKKSFELSTVNRAESDKIATKADEIGRRIDAMERAKA